MNEDIPPPDKGVVCCLQAEGVILRLKHSSLVPLIEEPDPFDDVASSCGTKQGSDAHGRLFSVVAHGLLPGKLGECLGISVRYFQNCFRVGAVCARTDQANGRIGKVIGETGQPVRHNNRVIVEKDNYLALGCGQTSVCLSATATPCLDLYHADVMILVCPGA